MSRKELAKVIAEAIQTEVAASIETVTHTVETALQNEIVPAIAGRVEETLQTELLQTAVPTLAQEVESALLSASEDTPMRRATDSPPQHSAAERVPRRTGNVGGGGARVFYVSIPGKQRIKEQLSARAGQVMAFIDRNRKASSAAIQAALKVNRNVIAGAVHELKKAGVIRVEDFSPAVATASEYQRRVRKPAPKAPAKRKK